MYSISKRLITFSLLAILVASCSTTPTGRAQLTLKSEAALAQEGTRQMAVIRASSPLVQDRATIDYVACVADAIVGTLEGNDAAMYWELAIVNQPDVNAFVMPGGKIVANPLMPKIVTVFWEKTSFAGLDQILVSRGRFSVSTCQLPCEALQSLN